MFFVLAISASQRELDPSLVIYESDKIRSEPFSGISKITGGAYKK